VESSEQPLHLNGRLVAIRLGLAANSTGEGNGSTWRFFVDPIEKEERYLSGSLLLVLRLGVPDQQQLQSTPMPRPEIVYLSQEEVHLYSEHIPALFYRFFVLT
jgi:hypothetical protein